MKEITLFFGSFNPPHNGHTAIVRYLLERVVPGGEVWFVVSPQNPLKAEALLAPERDRLAMTRIAASEQLAGLDVSVCDVEFGLPRPSYTIDTLRALEELCPDCRFSLLAGSDIPEQIGRWKESELLLSRYKFYIYPRPGEEVEPGGNLLDDSKNHENMVWLAGAPVEEYSSTDVRRTLLRGGDIYSMVSPGVVDYIKRHELWTNEI